MKTINQAQFQTILTGAGIGSGQISTLEVFRQWYITYRNSPEKNQAVDTVFTEDVWIDYIDNYDPEYKTPQQVLTPLIINPSTTKNIMKYKLDTVGLPTMPKNDTIQEKYSMWEEQFLAHLGLGDHDLADILCDDYVISTTGDDLINFNTKDKLIKNAMLIVTRDTHAYGFVDTKNGRSRYIPNGAKSIPWKRSCGAKSLRSFCKHAKTHIQQEHAINSKRICCQVLGIHESNGG